MGYKFYFPIEGNPKELNIKTYGGHGCGKIDIPANHAACYAMCDGKIASCGTYRDGNTYCSLECTQSGLQKTFYIRYLHGIYTVKTGDIVERGQLIGHTDQTGTATGDHLHLDFSYSPTSFSPVYGQLDGRTFIFDGKNIPLIDEVNLDKANNLYKLNGANDGKMGYCWLVMSSKLEKVGE